MLRFVVGLVGAAAIALTLASGATARPATTATATPSTAPTASAASAASAAPGPARVPPYGTGSLGYFNDILPPGEGSLDNLTALAGYEANHNHRPPHWSDQLQMYSRLTTAAPHIRPNQIGRFFKGSTFGVPRGDVATVEHPEAGVTIERDRRFGVPHIYGRARGELEFGIGWATAEDRLFMMDVLRHVGEGTLASFAGGSNVALDESTWTSAPYTAQDYQHQINWAEHASPEGPQIISDAQHFLNGINAYIRAARRDPLMMPGEYPALGMPLGPAPFTLRDFISIATIIGAELGNGGGQQLQNALLYENLEKKFGPEHRRVAGMPVGPKRPLPKQPPGVPTKHRRAAPAAHPNHQSVAHPNHQSVAHPNHQSVAHPNHQRAVPSGRQKPFSDHSGFATFDSFVDPADPEAPTTVHHRSFPYQTLPTPSTKTYRTIALPDFGTTHFVDPVVSGSVPKGTPLGLATDSPGAPPSDSPGAPPSDSPGAPPSDSPGARPSDSTGASNAPANPLASDTAGIPDQIAAARQALLGFPRAMSNALLVNAKHSASGHPLAVMGPQVSYWSPEILMEEDIHGPGISADGVSFPGTNLYVQMGHGRNYAWSATSSGQNITDTFAVALCAPKHRKLTVHSDHYLFHGRCVRMQTLRHTESWHPTIVDSTPAGRVTFQVQRTAYGLVIARARVHGRPVAYTNLRSTYMHEIDSALGFEMLNDPATMHDTEDFFNAIHHIKYTFNWFFANPHNIAYYDSGENPVRKRNTDPLFPTWAADAWVHYHGQPRLTPAGLTEAVTPVFAHPFAVDQTYFTSWNNKQARGYNDAATGQEFSSVYRSQLLDQNLRRYLKHGKVTLADLINAMGNAGTQDLRGVEVLPYALAIIGHLKKGPLANDTRLLRAWVASGAHRINRVHPGATGSYQQSAAVRIMDAWWPLLVRAEFEPVLGPRLLKLIEADFPINDEPGHGTTCCHVGSAFDVGFYGIVQKDLRAVLGDRVSGPLNRIYCGFGSLQRCRRDLEASLRRAAAESPQQVYPADGVCQAGNQMCSDSIQYRPLGVIAQPGMEWINRPTFQQADDLTGAPPEQRRLMLGGMHALLATVGLLASPAGGYHGTYVHGKPASFQAGAAIESFSPPLAGKAPGGDPANCSTNPVYNGPRKFAFEEPYEDTNHNGHYDPGEPYVDCNGDGRWDGNLMGGGDNTPRYYDHVADLVGARALVVGNGKQTIAVEVVDQEGLFDVYQARIRALVAKSGIHLNGIFISATHDESAPDSLGLGGVSETTSGVNNYFANYLVHQGALAIEKAYRRMRPAHIRYTEVLEPSNVRQCWSSYPFVDDQHMPVLEAMGRNGKTIATLVSVSQHDETTGFNGGSALDPGTPFTLDQENSWISSDWIHFFRLRLTSRLGGVGIEMAGSVGSNESPEVYDGRNISRTPQQFIDASHPAGCRTLFDVGAGTDAAGILHVPLGYYGETRAFGQDMAKPVITALQSGDWHFSTSNQIWGARANVCVPLTNLLFLFGAKLGVFADRPGYNSGCTTRYPVAPNGSTNGTSLQSQVAAFQIGDGEFLSIPGEVFPFTYLRGFLGPQDMPHPAYGLPPWLIPHMHAQFRFIDGLAEDMLGYIFPAGNAVGIPTAQDPNASGTDRFGCGHSDDSESTGAQTGNIVGRALVKLLDAHGGPPEEIVKGRYILPGDKLSRDPLGGPEIKCNVDTVFHASGPATGVELSTGQIVHPTVWMSLSGLPQTKPDRDTRGYFDAAGQRVWLDVFPVAK